MADFQATPEPSRRPRDEWDDWYDRYDESDPAVKLDMIRALLAEDRPAEFYSYLDFVTPVLDLRRDLGPDSEETFLAFLEEILASRPDVFSLGADRFERRLTCGRRWSEQWTIHRPMRF